ncbi:hypothetical protein B0T20DRAFT_388168 [Sordaria brevicollis]|uniref:Uncharacterized protein n=1 Tax=Sordaria brevicollis TaxID=83679 RepID=A0AAE0PMH7_SORBR|nr:hypothetical protein B0T20DRAFT_388168 [Sordaria brevicollis]
MALVLDLFAPRAIFFTWSLSLQTVHTWWVYHSPMAPHTNDWVLSYGECAGNAFPGLVVHFDSGRESFISSYKEEDRHIELSRVLFRWTAYCIGTTFYPQDINDWNNIAGSSAKLLYSCSSAATVRLCRSRPASLAALADGKERTWGLRPFIIVCLMLMTQSPIPYLILSTATSLCIGDVAVQKDRCAWRLQWKPIDQAGLTLIWEDWPVGMPISFRTWKIFVGLRDIDRGLVRIVRSRVQALAIWQGR